jgi:spore coat polysaccharide biosynthesis protein SpsF (cytidylyltransferase family)
MREADDLEHVTQFFYKNEADFRIHNFSLTANLNNIQLSVDTKEDLDLFIEIISSFTRPHWEYTLEDILKIFRELRPRNT